MYTYKTIFLFVRNAVKSKQNTFPLVENKTTYINEHRFINPERCIKHSHNNIITIVQRLGNANRSILLHHVMYMYTYDRFN